MKQSSFDATISALDAETSSLGAATSAIARSYRRGDSGDCRVGITPQMCNRVTNHGDMSTFSKPVCALKRTRAGGIVRTPTKPTGRKKNEEEEAADGGGAIPKTNFERVHRLDGDGLRRDKPNPMEWEKRLGNSRFGKVLISP